MANKFNIGDKVRFINHSAHEDYPRFYPVYGTVGEIIDDDGHGYFIEWPPNSVNVFESSSYENCWWCGYDSVELVKE